MRATISVSRALLSLGVIVSVGLCVLAFGETNSPDSPHKTITVILRFDESYSSDLLDAMKSGLESVMRPEGLRVEWWSFEEALGREIFNDWALVRFKGSCTSQRFKLQDEIEGRLALTYLSNNTPTAFADVYCNSVRDLLWPEGHPDSLVRAEFLLGRALGRVVAHELYHILTKTTKHGTLGVARPALTRQDLVASEIGFEKRESELLRESTVPRNRAKQSGSDGR